MRLPEVRPDDLTPEQRPLYESFASMPEARSGAGYQVRRDDGAFLGPWSVLIHFPGIAPGLNCFVAGVDKLQGVSDSARQVVILTVGGHFNAAYEMYAHAVVAADAGLRTEQIATLCSDRRPDDLTDEQRLAADVTSALLRGGVVPEPLYEEVVARFGRAAIDTITFVTIHYFAICAMLNSYDVPPGRPTNWRDRTLEAQSSGGRS